MCQVGIVSVMTELTEVDTRVERAPCQDQVRSAGGGVEVVGVGLDIREIEIVVTPDRQAETIQGINSNTMK